MDLVVNKVVQLDHVHVADGDLAVERLAGTTVIKNGLTGFMQTCLLQHRGNVGFMRTVEDRGRDGNTALGFFGKLDQRFVVEALYLVMRFTRIDFGKLRAKLADVHRLAILFEHLADLLAHTCACPCEVGFEDLADVHARRHAERVQADVDMRAVFEERHVLDRNDTRDDALVTVTAGHLVARLDLALHSDEDLDHLHDAEAFHRRAGPSRPCP